MSVAPPYRSTTDERPGGRIDRVQICLLGPLEVRADPATPIEVGGARLRRLLILLALEPGRVVSVADLVDALWEGDPPAAAGNALQALVSRLRRAVPGLPVDARPGGYRLALGRDAVDLHRFEAAVLAGRALLPHDPTGARRRLDEALALWRGPALIEVADAPFARAPVARLQELRLVAIEQLIEARSALEDPAHLVPWLRELVATHPLREGLAGQLIRTLHRAGRSAEALAEYDRLRRTLADTLGTDPGPELVALHLALLRGTRPDALASPAGPPDTRHEPRPDGVANTTGEPASPAAQARTRGDLPAALTSFVGREAAVDRVGDLLDRSRLVTLTGPGGAGKTRLAVESARAADRPVPGRRVAGRAGAGDRPGRGAAGPARRCSACASRRSSPAAGRASRPARRPNRPCWRSTRWPTRRALLVLDNCEHLLDAAAELADRLLAACPELRVLATSREPLGITGEALHPVGSARPAAGRGRPGDRAGVPRGAALRGPGRRGPARLPGGRPDGRPGGGHLPGTGRHAAGHRARRGPAPLDDGGPGGGRGWTTGSGCSPAGSRTALPRHQTLRAVVDWSWDLLDRARARAVAPARRLRRRRDPGRGRAGLRRRRLAADEVLDRLAALVDKSLLLAAGDGEPRYRMLETIREYGLERLAEAGEAQRRGGPPRRRLPAPGRARPTRSCAAATSSPGWTGSRRARQPARRAALGDRGRRGDPRGPADRRARLVLVAARAPGRGRGPGPRGAGPGRPVRATAHRAGPDEPTPAPDAAGRGGVGGRVRDRGDGPDERVCRPGRRQESAGPAVTLSGAGGGHLLLRLTGR